MPWKEQNKYKYLLLTLVLPRVLIEKATIRLNVTITIPNIVATFKELTSKDTLQSWISAGVVIFSIVLKK